MGVVDAELAKLASRGSQGLSQILALLAVAYTLTWKATSPPADKVLINDARLYAVDRHAVSIQAIRELKLRDAVTASEHATVMHQLLASCGIALAITAVLSIALGWLVAGRVLRPLRTMTAATHRINEQNPAPAARGRGPRRRAQAAR